MFMDKQNCLCTRMLPGPCITTYLVCTKVLRTDFGHLGAFRGQWMLNFRHVKTSELVGSIFDVPVVVKVED